MNEFERREVVRNIPHDVRTEYDEGDNPRDVRPYRLEVNSLRRQQESD